MQDLTIPDDKCQIAGFTHLSSRPSVRCVPQVLGSTELAKRRRTIYFRAENSNVSEQKVGSKEQFCRFRCDAADDHSDSRCASAQNLPRSPALSAPSVPAS